MHCLKCGAEAFVKNGFVRGIQRYKCKNCGYQFTRDTPRGCGMRTKVMALALYLSGMSMRAIGAILEVAGQSVMRWIKKFGREYAAQPVEKMDEEIEIDEMHHFVGKKNGFFGYGKYWVIPLAGSSHGNVAIVVRLPLQSCATEPISGEPGEYIQMGTAHITR